MNINEKEFNNIYSAYANKIYNLAFKITGDQMIAEDITHDTFIQIIDKHDTFRGESNLITWIYAIAKNQCFKQLNRIKKKRFQDIENLIEIANQFSTNSQYSDLEKQLYIKQIKEGCLLGLLRCLSYYQRISFILYIFNDLSINEISHIINKSTNATSILIHRARSNLKNFLCKNCSLYHESNNCKCENLISFSIDQGWINKNDNIINADKIENELNLLKKEIILYKSLEEHKPPLNLINKILHYISQNDFLIFTEKKVK